ncbi:MAG TPA: methyltransferase domain-containing protein [Motiliproteus sp.]
MSHADRERWNARYAIPGDLPAAAEILCSNQHLLPRQGTALDLACGRGANALLLARHGLHTQAWDIAETALTPLQTRADQEHLPLTTHAVDLDSTPLPSAAFDVITVSGFLQRQLCPAIVAALKPGGLLFYQTFTQQRLADSGGPSNPAFLLAPGELLSLFAALEPLVYREERDAGDHRQGLRNQAGLVARKPHG